MKNKKAIRCEVYSMAWTTNKAVLPYGNTAFEYVKNEMKD